jgi:hypothetical protein
MVGAHFDNNMYTNIYGLCIELLAGSVVHADIIVVLYDDVSSFLYQCCCIHVVWLVCTFRLCVAPYEWPDNYVVFSFHILPSLLLCKNIVSSVKSNVNRCVLLCGRLPTYLLFTPPAINASCSAKIICTSYKDGLYS